MDKIIRLPLDRETVRTLRAGDRVLLNGVLYTGRDDAHIRLRELLESGAPLPISLEDLCIYYVGPCPAKPGQVIGSAGPTTSGRMDSIAPLLMEHGLRAMIGKGLRSAAVVESMKKNCCVYFAAIGGAGALLSRCIREASVVAFEDLGPEAIYRLRVENFPVTVAIDCQGNDLYAQGRARYRKN